MSKQIIIIVFFLFLITTLTVYSDELTPTPTVSQDQQQNQQKVELEKKIGEYQKKLDELREQRNSLSSQIQFMDTQINLTTLKIQETEQKISTTEKEIELLTSKIEGLDSSLDFLSKQLLHQIVEGYTSKSVSLFDVLFDSNQAVDFINRFNYVKTAQENNHRILVQVQTTKMNFEEQKELREKKKIELNALKQTLIVQKADLQRQQESKRKLLGITQNDENVFRRLIEEARRQIDSFKKFVASTGLGIIPVNGLGTGEGGWYYSQRDERWAKNRMGDSNETVLDVGCFISSIAMIMKFYGVDMTPAEIAANPRYFHGGSASACFPTNYPSAYACIPSTHNGSWPKGLRYHNISMAQIDDYLNKNIPIIAGVRGASHYVVLKKKVDGQYIMNDPIYGPDKKVSDHYSISGLFGVFE